MSHHGPPPDLAIGTTFAGMDKDKYPGDDVMLALWRNTDLQWTGLYLTPAPSQGHHLGWMDRYDYLRQVGWGVAPVYVGRQVESIPHADHRMTGQNGLIDGDHAARLATMAGIHPPAVIYLDFEHGPPVTEAAQEYYAAWAYALQKKRYTPGVYCLHGIAAGLTQVVPGGVVWAVNYSKYARKTYTDPLPRPDPAGSGVHDATLWQLRGNVHIEYNDLNGVKKKLLVDLNSSSVKDPSKP